MLLRLSAWLLLCAATSTSAQVLTWVANGLLPFDGPATVSSGQTLDITGAGNHDFNGLAITNNGIVNWTGGLLRSGSGGTLTNHATFNDSAAGTFNNAYQGTGGTTFINASTGTYFKTASTTVFDAPFTNQGRIDVASGATVRLNSGGTFADGSSMTGSGGLELANGVLTASGTMSLSNLLFKGGSIAGAHTLNGVITWTDGTFNNSGSTTIGGSGTLNISGGNQHDFDGHTIINHGVVNWTGGEIRSGHGGTFTNHATFNDSASSSFNNAYQGTGGTTFINEGTYAKSGSGSLTTFSANFVNNDTIDIASGATLRLTGASTFNDGSKTTGAGALELTTGTLTANGAVTFSNFQFQGGEIEGTHTLHGAITWTAGNFNNSATTTFGPTAVVTISSSNQHDFDGHAIINHGVVHWTAGEIRSGHGGTFTNNEVFNDTASTSFNNAYLGTGGTTFINNGTYAKSGAGTLTTFSASFVNNGTVDIAADSILRLTGASTFNDGSKTTGAGALELTTGTLTAGGTVTFSNLQFKGGEIQGTATLNGAIAWTAGNFNNSATTTIGESGVLTISGTNQHDFDGHAIVNDGVVNWTGGEIRSGHGGTFTNNAAFNDSAGSSFNNAYLGTGGTTFINHGTYAKSGVGASTNFAAHFVNHGTIDVAAGATLRLTGGATFNAGSSSTGSGLLEQANGTLVVNGSATFSNLLFSGGVIDGAPVFNGAITWTGGNFNHSGTTTLSPTATLTISGGNHHDYDGHAMVNNGTVIWNGGEIRSGHGGTFTNNHVFRDSSGGSSINNAYLGTGGTTFINAAGATYQKNDATTTTISASFVNRGTIQVNAGALKLTGATSLENLSSMQGSGTLEMGGGTLSPNGTVTLQNLLFSAGALIGSHELLGGIRWTGGNWNSSGTTTIGESGVLFLEGANHDFDGRTIVIEGRADWSAGHLRSGHGGVFRVAEGGVFLDRAAASGATQTINNAYLGAGGTTFVNQGTYAKTSSGTTRIDVPFTNDATSGGINVNAGTLRFASTYTQIDGSLIVSQGTTAQFDAPLNFTDGTLGGNGTIMGAVTNSGAVAPGAPETNYIGQLTFNTSLTLTSTSLLAIQIDGPSSFDKIQAQSAALNGSLGVTFTNDAHLLIQPTDVFVVFTTTTANGLSGTFTDLENGARFWTADGLGTFQINYEGNRFILSNFEAVPEPSTYALLGIGVATLWLAQRRRKAK